MRNAWRNMNRRTHPHVLHDADAVAAIADDGPQRGGAETQVVDRMLDADLVAGLRSLSHDHRAVVLLVDVDGLTYGEAANVLGVPTGTVMSRLHRARTRLRHRLEHGRPSRRSPVM